MGQPHNQALTLAPASVRVPTLNAARVGAVDTNVLRFDGPAVTVGTAIVLTTNANNGSIFAVSEPGNYFATLIFATTAADGTAFGVSKNATGAALTAVPTISVAGMIEAATILPVVGQSPAGKLATVITVSQAEAGAVGGCLIRFHALDDGGTAPGEVIVATALATLTRLSDYEG